MSWLFYGTLSVVVFFTATNLWSKWRYSKSTLADVERALLDVLEPGGGLGAWDLFLSWPIDDRYCESVRQRCIQIAAEHRGTGPGEAITAEGLRKVAALLEEVRERLRTRDARLRG